jgi:hypothetical protein
MVAIADYPSRKSQSVEKSARHPQGELARDTRDALVYEWVRFEGKSQVWVAAEMGLSQGTVSRILQRVERLQAHAPDRPDGRLDPQERLRVQRWLTYERNERILASCLRIAHDVEGFVDVSRSTIERNGLASVEQEIRTVHGTLDRSGTAARFLRLAFRINMEQLKLTEMDPLAPLPALTPEELAELDRDDGARNEGAASEGASEQPPPATALKLAELEPPQSPVDFVEQPDAQESSDASDQTGGVGSDEKADNAHGAHRRILAQRGASIEETCSCGDCRGSEKNVNEGRMLTGDEPHLRQHTPCG